MIGAKDGQLKQWTVTDPQGYDTTVAVYNLDFLQEDRSQLVQDRLHQLRHAAGLIGNPEGFGSSRGWLLALATVTVITGRHAAFPDNVGTSIRCACASIWSPSSSNSVRPDVLWPAGNQMHRRRVSAKAFPSPRLRACRAERATKGYHGVAVISKLPFETTDIRTFCDRNRFAPHLGRVRRNKPGLRSRWCCIISTFPPAAIYRIPNSIRNSTTSSNSPRRS